MSGILTHRLWTRWILRGNAKVHFKVVVPIYLFTSSVWGLVRLCILANPWCRWVSGFDRLSLCGFNLHSPNNTWKFFQVLILLPQTLPSYYGEHQIDSSMGKPHCTCLIYLHHTGRVGGWATQTQKCPLGIQVDTFMSPHQSKFHSFFQILEAERLRLIHTPFPPQTSGGNSGKVIPLLETQLPK